MNRETVMATLALYDSMVADGTINEFTEDTAAELERAYDLRVEMKDGFDEARTGLAAANAGFIAAFEALEPVPEEPEGDGDGGNHDKRQDPVQPHQNLHPRLLAPPRPHPHRSGTRRPGHPRRPGFSRHRDLLKFLHTTYAAKSTGRHTVHACASLPGILLVYPRGHLTKPANSAILM